MTLPWLHAIPKGRSSTADVHAGLSVMTDLADDLADVILELLLGIWVHGPCWTLFNEAELYHPLGN
jgi:hypothetical protein